MAVTNSSFKSRRLRGFAAVSLVSLLLIVSFQNCAVEVSEDTPGAAGACEPTTADVNEFNTALTTILQNNTTLASGATACGTCHLTTSGNTAAARFGIDPNTDAATQISNWCAASSVADKFTQGYLSGAHPGGTYSDSDIDALLTWANSL